MTDKHVSVPVEPSEEMIQVAHGIWFQLISGKVSESVVIDAGASIHELLARLYKAMIEAAPRPGDGLAE